MIAAGGSPLAGLRAGDEDALRELFRRLAPQAHALAERVAGAHAAAAVVEEVFLLAWREPERWNEAAFELEALRCVRDTALGVRRRGLSAAAALAGTLTETGRPAAAPSERTIAVGAAAADAVRAALYTLEDEQRELLESAWFEGGDLEGLAEQHGLDAAAAAALLTDALERLADAIEARL